MAFTITEHWTSRAGNDGDNPSRVRVYTLVTNAANFDTDDPFTALASAAPTTDASLPRRTIQIDPIGPYSYGGKVTYGRQGGSDSAADPPEVGDEEFNFRISADTKHITVGREHIVSLPASPANPYQGAIGVTADDVQGCDILVPVFGFSVTKWFDTADIDSAFIQALCAQCTTTNNGTWRGYAAGEVLFLGASGGPVSGPSSAMTEITFDFAAAKNLASVSVGSLGTIAVKGWEHLWVRFKDDVASNKFVQVPESAHVERVYESSTFSSLPIASS
jgi:hypothetical protein